MTRAPAVSAKPVISSSGSSLATWPGRMTRTRIAFSLAMPSIRSVSYNFLLECKVAAELLEGPLYAILVPRPRGEKAVWQIVINLAAKLWEKCANAMAARAKDGVHHGLVFLHFSCKGRFWA